jgi:phenylacetate-coenzyme A ligase PaaK-like adenylate-forming protein
MNGGAMNGGACAPVIAGAPGGPSPVAERPPRTPLDDWIAARIGCSEGRPSPEALAAWQLLRLRETVAGARRLSPFYARHLAHLPDGAPRDLESLRELPFLTADDLRREGQRILCVRPDEVERIVTMPTSGTTGSPKRVFFTAGDQELTVDFFHHGMSTFTRAGDRVLVLMPGERPGSVGELLARALPRLGAEVTVHGPVRDVDAALEAVITTGATVIVGIPTQVLSLVHRGLQIGTAVTSVRTVLLSADRLPGGLRRAVETGWGCTVFDHYGSTEMGLGGGVECAAHAGYHLREADLLFEVVSPETGEPVGPGERGEVVFTTLTRAAMPLVRYRTGDIAAFVPGACRCGSALRLLGPVTGRLGAEVRLAGGAVLTIADLDAALLGLDGVADFAARVGNGDGRDELEVRLRAEGPAGQAAAAARDALLGAAPLAGLVRSGRLSITVGEIDPASWPCSNGMIKRTLVDERDTGVADA